MSAEAERPVNNTDPSDAGTSEAPAASLPEATPLTVPVVVTTETALAEAIAGLQAGHGPVFVDAERANGYRYSSRAYLVQLYREGSDAVLIDPIAITDFTPLQEALADLVWVFHAASQDLPCLRELGLEPPKIFDTELGGRLAGFERVGLAVMVEKLLGLHLPKAHSAADWSTRPLPQAWLDYAALDVELLPEIYHKLTVILDEQGKTAIAQQEFDAVLNRDPKPPAAEPWRRLSGIHTISDRKVLAVARELWHARDEYARSIDSAPGRLIADGALVVAAQSKARTAPMLLGEKGFHGRTAKSELHRWWAAIERGRASTDLPATRVKSDGPPPPRFWSSKRPLAAAMLQASKSTVGEVAEELGMPVENLLTPDTLRRLCWSEVAATTDAVAEGLRELGARPWQVEATAQRIATSFVDALQKVSASPASES
ncbi:ribonuclease D [Humidisolicoccus flavus]|uniref:ribonuclease D n=1 Tax=Humidisolicoccus flavus TaxID=3111414 RepID=UPI0032471AE0